MPRLFLLLAAAAATALGMSCRAPTICERAQAPVLFVGQVIAGGVGLQEDPYDSDVPFAEFEVLEMLRGQPPATGRVRIGLTNPKGMGEAIPYFPGKKYLVGRRSLEDQSPFGQCEIGFDVEARSAEFSLIRRQLAGELNRTIIGKVSSIPVPELLILAATRGWAMPLHAATVTATRGNRQFLVKTGRDGEYTLKVPDSGIYWVDARFGNYKFERPVRAEIQENGCAVADLGLTANSTISGRVWDHQGKTVPDAEVGLVDLDRPPQRPGGHAFFYTADTSREHHEFTFKHVPVGRYLLVYNPGGPTARAPHESSYFPLNSSRQSAGVIEVNRDGMHLEHLDLIIGRAVPFRAVTVVAELADGRPMPDPDVVVTEVTPTGVAPRWRQIQRIKSSVVLEVPADRKIRIELTDLYKRPLAGTYISIHEPGAAPIGKTYIVR